MEEKNENCSTLQYEEYFLSGLHFSNDICVFRYLNKFWTLQKESDETWSHYILNKLKQESFQLDQVVVFTKPINLGVSLCNEHEMAI